MSLATVHEIRLRIMVEEGNVDQAKRDEMFGILCKMSDRQVDQAVKDRLQTFIGRTNEEIKDELLGLIDDSVFCAWTSDFEIRVMERIWFEIGGSKEELAERNGQLEDKSKLEEFKARFKWQACGQG